MKNLDLKQSLTFDNIIEQKNNLIKNNTRIYDVTSKYTGFLGSIRRGLKKSI